MCISWHMVFLPPKKREIEKKGQFREDFVAHYVCHSAFEDVT